ncbi:hypothetical protein VCHA47P369_20177 [Vibrio chagasii]|nr:hypothetical protein VCHA27O13_90172 [Vibrio chagasii]CAH6797626.1 hypothetical protein VCHA34P116_110008 [Vibrio chagasii]CAH6814380.1 hypothetical protein VCHA36P164_130007 [Vibrio chagasii]CAH6817695.1 hypothetical protein VCHA28FP16_140083 [Vibrio chagasii]CAH6836309.1 hypothetical protein VCHA31O71_10184 [Vibrio chagasii]
MRSVTQPQLNGVLFLFQSFSNLHFTYKKALHIMQGFLLFFHKVI